jgi:hypothetical protein
VNFLRSGLVLALSLCVTGVAQAQKTDIVVLNNGDRITCEVDGLSSGLLTVKTDDMGTIRIEWDKVRSVTSSRTFEVETTGGALWYGSLAAGNPGQLVVVGATRTTLDQLAIFRITTIEKGFWHRLDGSINVGGSVTKSSGVGQVYANLDVGAKTPKSSWSLSYDSTTTFRENEPDSGRYLGQFIYTHNLRKRWFLLGFSQLESNEDLGYDLRVAVGGGGGRNLIQSTRRVFQLIGGLSVNREQPLEAEALGNLELMSTVRYSFVSYDYPKSETTLSLTVLPSVTDLGRVRLTANLKASRALFTNDFVFTTTAFDEYDNRPPAGAVNTNDYGLSFSLGWKF